MVPARFSGRILFMTTISLVLVSISLSYPWYFLSYQVHTELPVDYTYEGSRAFYTDFVEWDGSSLVPYGVSDPDRVEKVMDLERSLIALWIVLGCAFMVAVLLNLRWPCFVIGIALLLIASLALIQFAGRIDEAVYGSPHYPSGIYLEPETFSGTSSTDSATVWYHPELGFWMALAGGLTLLGTVALRFSTIMESIMDDWNSWRYGLRSG